MVRDGGIFADSDLPQGFYLELREPTRYIHTGSVSFSSGYGSEIRLGRKRTQFLNIYQIQIL